MDEKIVDLITKLAATGSSTALWFYGIYVIGTVLKFVVGFGCGLLAVLSMCKTIKETLNDKKD